MKTIFCLILVVLGVIIAAPLTLILLAIDIARENVNSIRKFMTGTDSPEQMKAQTRDELKEYMRNKKQS